MAQRRVTIEVSEWTTGWRVRVLSSDLQRGRWVWRSAWHLPMEYAGDFATLEDALEVLHLVATTGDASFL
jgi:hypothetical protein